MRGEEPEANSKRSFLGIPLPKLRHFSKSSRRAKNTAQSVKESPLNDASQSCNPKSTPENSQIRETQPPQPAQQTSTAQDDGTQFAQSSGSQTPTSLKSGSRDPEPDKTSPQHTAIEKTIPEPIISSPPIVVPSRETLDRQETLFRYDEAYHALQNAIKDSCKSHGAKFKDLSDVLKDVDNSNFIMNLIKVLDSQASEVEDRCLWNTCKSTIKYICHALKPFTKNVLNVAMQGSAVWLVWLDYELTLIDSGIESIRAIV
jgi:hypothetical protein